MPDRSAPVVVVIGSSHVDLVARARRLPVRGETLPGEAFEIHAGGKGGNQAVAAARAGASARFIGRLGADAFGERLTAALADAGVDIRWLGIDDRAATGCSTVLTGEGGDYASIIVPGSSMALTPDLVRESREAFAGAGAVVGQLEIDPMATAAALGEGRAAGAVTILNAAPAPASFESLPAAVLASTDVLVVNRVEAAMLLGLSPDAPLDPASAAERLKRERGMNTVIVTLGENGLVARAGATDIALAGHIVTPVDTIGAGDAFIGALACSLAKRMSIEQALRRANAAGALAVTRSGGSAAPSAADVDAFLADHGV